MRTPRAQRQGGRRGRDRAEALAREQTAACARLLGKALWQGRDGIPDSEDLAFEASQRAELSDAGVALSRAGAREAAHASGAGPAAAAYEAALAERRLVDADYAAAVGDQSGDAAARRARLGAEHDALDAKIAGQVATLRRAYPRYWQFRNPDPLSLAAVRGTGGGSPLLHAGEALVSFMAPDGAEHGLVFAVSRAGSAWAEIGMTGKELAAAIHRLRVCTWAPTG